MVQTIICHGGPWHGRTTQIPDGRDHFHILEAPNQAIARAIAEGAAESEGLQILTPREGMYSQVHNVTGGPLKGEFEWDGWRSHD